MEDERSLPSLQLLMSLLPPGVIPLPEVPSSSLTSSSISSMAESSPKAPRWRWHCFLELLVRMKLLLLLWLLLFSVSPAVKVAPISLLIVARLS